MSWNNKLVDSDEYGGAMTLTREIFSLTIAGLALMFCFFAYLINRPNKSEYLEATIEHYLKVSTELGVGKSAAASDCRVEEADQDDRSRGVAMVGLCSFVMTDGITTFYYQVALGYMSNVEYFYTEERRN